jgi:hypothetical protein
VFTTLDKLEKSIQYKHCDYYIEKVSMQPKKFNYKLLRKSDNVTIFDGSRDDLINKIENERIDPLTIFKLELLKHIF